MNQAPFLIITMLKRPILIMALLGQIFANLSCTTDRLDQLQATSVAQVPPIFVLEPRFHLEAKNEAELLVHSNLVIKSTKDLLNHISVIKDPKHEFETKLSPELLIPISIKKVRNKNSFRLNILSPEDHETYKTYGVYIKDNHSEWHLIHSFSFQRNSPKVAKQSMPPDKSESS